MKFLVGCEIAQGLLIGAIPVRPAHRSTNVVEVSSGESPQAHNPDTARQTPSCCLVDESIQWIRPQSPNSTIDVPTVLMLEPHNSNNTSLDPECWQSLRATAHRMLDESLDHVQHCRSQPVWKKMKPEVRDSFRTAIPSSPSSLESVQQHFAQHIQPYTLGNVHPGFMGWVQGGGTPVGMLAEVLACGLNANLGGRDQAPLEVEKEVVDWMRQLFSFPGTSSGVFLSGSSMANFVAVLIARNAALQMEVRKLGLFSEGQQLVAYTSSAAHRCVSQAMDMAGIGSCWLRKIEVDVDQRIDLKHLHAAIKKDRDDGHRPFCLIGCAGTVDTGAVDDLVALRRIATEHGIWLHVDGAFAALGLMSSRIAPLLRGIENADSVAFDFHKWAQVPYDAGFLLVRDGAVHLASFESPADYLSRDQNALSAASPWPCDLGPELSRSFRALKTWMTLRVYGTEQLGLVMDQHCSLARYLSEAIHHNLELELLAPVPLNIVCFRYRDDTISLDASGWDLLNQQIVAAVQCDGLVVPSSTRIRGTFAIRAALFNHRTTKVDVDHLIHEVLGQGRHLCSQLESVS
jgi:aromatic-L-amino-acid/L-tryptophan decarboxylase